jgi:hypothetical protein
MELDGERVAAAVAHGYEGDLRVVADLEARRARARDAVVQAFPQDDDLTRPDDVERVARALFLHDHPGSEGAWDAPGEFGKGAWRSKAHAVLAALSARPDQAQEVERLREEVQRLTAMESVDTAFYRLTVTERDHARAKADRLTRERDAALARATTAEERERVLREGIETALRHVLPDGDMAAMGAHILTTLLDAKGDEG